MNINIEICDNGCVIINGKITVANNLSIREIQLLAKEYMELGTDASVYTPEAIEMKWGRPGLLLTNLARMDKGGTLKFMEDTIEKVSQSFFVLVN